MAQNQETITPKSNPYNVRLVSETAKYVYSIVVLEFAHCSKVLFPTTISYPTPPDVSNVTRFGPVDVCTVP